MWESHADSDNRLVGRPVPDRALPIYTVNDADVGVGRRGCYYFADCAGTIGDTAQARTPVLLIPSPKP